MGTTDQNGVIHFSGLNPGLYLLVRVHVAPENAAYLYEPCFLSMPQIVDGTLIYQYEASPKYVPKKPDLPQTGQLKWPIPVMLVLGTVCFLTGMELCFDRKETDDAESL